jgi:hypothetical protein
LQAQRSRLSGAIIGGSFFLLGLLAGIAGTRLRDNARDTVVTEIGKRAFDEPLKRLPQSQTSFGVSNNGVSQILLTRRWSSG